MNMPPEVLRSRSFTRFTMRVGLPHLGQSVLFEVSIILSRPAVLAILAMVEYSPVRVSRGLGRHRAVRLWQTREKKQKLYVRNRNRMILHWGAALRLRPVFRWTLTGSPLVRYESIRLAI